MITRLAWLVFAVICICIAIRTPVTTDITLFLPENGNALLKDLREGPAARLILVAIEGDAEPAARASHRLAEALRKSALFVRVVNGSAEPEQALGDKIYSYRYLLGGDDYAERFSIRGLRSALEKRLRALASPVGIIEKRFLAHDPAGVYLDLLRSWQNRGQQQPERRFGVWFAPPQPGEADRALLLLESRAAGFDIDAQEQIVRTIDSAFASANDDQNGTLRLLKSGPALFAIASRSTIRQETQWLSALASGLLVMLLLLIYRSFRLLLLGALPLIFAIFTAWACLGLLFGGIHGITLAFGITLLGVVIDYPIHFFSHLNRQESSRQSLLRIWPTLRLSAFTTALGYTAMLSTDFSGLAQLGLFAIIGLLSALLVTRYFLPCLMPLGMQLKHDFAKSAACLRYYRASGAIKRQGQRIVLGLVALSAVSIILHEAPVWENDLAALSPVPATALRLDNELRAALRAPDNSKLLVIRGADAQTVLRQSEALETTLKQLITRGWLDGFDMAAFYLPSLARQRERQRSLPAPGELRDRLRQAASDLPFKPDLFNPFLQAVEKSRNLPLLTPVSIADSVLYSRVRALLFESQSQWLALLPLNGVRNTAALRHFFSHYKNVEYVDLHHESSRVLAGFRDAALARLGIGILLIVTALAFLLRSVRRAVNIILPVLFAISLNVSVLLLFGVQLSLFHLVTLLLVLGIGLDYCLFFARGDINPAVRRRTLLGIMLCGGSTLTVFVMLALSQIPVLRAIGLTAAIGVCTSFIMALLFASQQNNMIHNVLPKRNTDDG